MKISLIPQRLFLLLFAINTFLFLGAVSAQNDAPENQSKVQIPQPGDAELAEGIKLLGTGSNESLKESLNKFSAALSEFRKNGRKEAEAHASEWMAVAYQRLSNYTNALKFYKDALSLAEETRSEMAQASILRNLGSLYLDFGKHSDLIKCHKRASALFAKSEYREQYGDLQTNMIYTVNSRLIEKKEFKKSLKYLKALLSVSKKIGDLYGQGTIYMSFGFTYSAMGKPELDLESNKMALTAFVQLNDKEGEASALNNIGVNYHLGGNHAQALKYYDRSLQIRRSLDQKDKSKELTALYNIGLIYEDSGNYSDALKTYHEGLLLSQKVENAGMELTLLLKLAYVHKENNTPKDAIKYYDLALSKTRTLGDKTSEVSALREMASIHQFVNGENKIALGYLKAALPLYRDANNKKEIAATLREIGQTYTISFLPEKAFGYLLEAREIYREIGDVESEAQTLLQISHIQLTMRKPEAALETSSKALALFRASKNGAGEMAVLMVRGPLLMEMGKKEEGLQTLKQATSSLTQNLDLSGDADGIEARNFLTFLQKFLEGVLKIDDWEADLQNDKELLTLVEKGLDVSHQLSTKYPDMEFFEIMMLSMASLIHTKSNPQKAFDYMTQAEKCLEGIEHENIKAVGTMMVGLGFAALTDNRIDPESFNKASFYLHKTLMFYRQVNNASYESILASMLSDLWKDQGNPRMAIFYAKRAVNLLQELRAELSDLSKELQNSYIDRVGDTYRSLADLLISEGRFLEAQKVLDMLKESEYFEYVRRDAEEIKKLSQRIDLTPAERRVLQKLVEIEKTLTSIGAEFDLLQKEKNQLGNLFTKQQRYEELDSQLASATAAFVIFLKKGLENELGENEGKRIVKEIDDTRKIQGSLREKNESVVLYTVLTENRYRVILTTGRTQKDAKTDIAIADLNRKIFAFREALQNPAIDPRPLGKELYDILIRPVEADLKITGAKNLLWSLDGTLRYIPLGALWDGKQYLAESYGNVVITSTVHNNFNAATDPNWRILGAGVAKTSTFTGSELGENLSFAMLPNVITELNSIVRDEDSATGELGSFPGKRLIDKNFTANSLRGNLIKRDPAGKRKYNLLHLATHFRLGENSGTSFLLLGDNSALTLEQIDYSPEFDLSDIELVTLSACNTAFGNSTDSRLDLQSLENNNGKEVDSLATFVEKRGAKAVIASLWSVADESTSLFMSEFYRLRKETPGLTKAEAIRLAQLEMINGKLNSPADKTSRAEIVGSKKAAANMPKFAYDNNRPYAHPYYWSPFILIGNWR